MASKHFIDKALVDHMVIDGLESLIYQHPDLVLNRNQKFIFNGTHNGDAQISLISGGGAGHEPAHAGYVGDGMLSAAVSGNIFASPGVKQILAAIRQVGGKAGTILIVKNYTGDVFHFHQAAEKARAALGRRVEVLVIGDDVSVARERLGKVGRRGLAGTVLVHKILGSLAAANTVTMDQCLEMGRLVQSGLATVAASLDRVHIPGQSTLNTQHLDSDDVEVGMGIHNEPGVEVVNPPPSTSVLLDGMIGYLLDQDDPSRSYVDFVDVEELVLMVNNLGGLSVLELSGITTHILRKLSAKNLYPSRVFSGTFMTSLNGPGFSITLLRANKEMLKLLDAPTSTLGWVPPRKVPVREHSKLVARITTETKTKDVDDDVDEVDAGGSQIELQIMKPLVLSACQSAIRAEPDITRADTIVGDGDCGTTLKRGAEAVQGYFHQLPAQGRVPAVKVFLQIAHLVEENMDGTSGAIYSLFFNGLCSALRLHQADSTLLSFADIVRMAQHALNVVQRVTPARAGDRTLMDALEPFVASLDNGMDAAVNAAREGMDRTRGMRPAFGRAVYVNAAGWDRVPDPGACSVVEIVEGLRNGSQSTGM